MLWRLSWTGWSSDVHRGVRQLFRTPAFAAAAVGVSASSFDRNVSGLAVG
ncbi:MAG: hypothetical protein ACT4QD_25020 [Acidobacteriota bacterium]